ncbi:PQQ-dependent sugar dehydrogenase [Marinicella sp. W31]|uniref:PQQ-dependent sugar dehydrogenase n=1 Tax=Marinicella sp. W31 TaxID=3023713 RepID=UPI003756956B
MLSSGSVDANAFKVKRTTVVQGLANPWDIAFINADEALVTEKNGGLKRVNMSTGEVNNIAGLPLDVEHISPTDRRDNSGLFGIALDPDFSRNKYIYLAYSAGLGGLSTTRLIKAKLQRDQLQDIQVLLTAEPFSIDRFHYGGGLVFGVDGKLYLTVGERYFNEIDQPSLPVAQDIQDRRGKIYRINSDGSIPKDNPVLGQKAVPGIYALGIRAAQGLTVHPTRGEIWFTEHGPRQGDEVNVLAAGANYGWPNKTKGRYRNQNYLPKHIEGAVYTDPVWSWSQTVAPTGLTFYSGSEFPHWHGSLFVAGLSAGSLWRLSFQGQQVKAVQQLFVDDPVRLRSIKQSPDGRLYMLTDEINGRILRLDLNKEKGLR